MNYMIFRNGNVEADRLAARGCAAHLLEMRTISGVSPRMCPLTAPRVPRPPKKNLPSLRRRCSRTGHQPDPRTDPRLPPFNCNQPPHWRAFFSLSCPTFPFNPYACPCGWLQLGTSRGL